MFEGSEFPGSLDEAVFNQWLENGRESKIGFNYLLIVWEQHESMYRPVYIEKRDDINQYRDDRTPGESLVAVYDLYSESRIF